MAAEAFSVVCRVAYPEMAQMSKQKGQKGNKIVNLAVIKIIEHWYKSLMFSVITQQCSFSV